MSVVIPCLNEAAGITGVVDQAFVALAAAKLRGEVIVVDNGSDDGSAELARAAGATVIAEPRLGYGNAYLTGLASAQNPYIVMVDGDGTYPVEALGLFVAKLRAGADIVLGNRFAGAIEPRAMHWSNRYIGNPALTGMLNLLFGSGVSDAHCGLRAIRRTVLPELKLSATGMEFASEMVIKAGKRHLRIVEVPIDYRPRLGESKLARGRDAWRHVRLMLAYSPTVLFAIPGLLATLTGLTGLTILAAWISLPEPWTGVAMASSMLTIVGVGIIQLGLFTRTHAVLHLGEHDELLERNWQRFRLEHGLALAGVTLVGGLGIALASLLDGIPDPRLGLLGLTLAAIALQGAFGAFFLSILGLSDDAVARRRARHTDPVLRMGTAPTQTPQAQREPLGSSEPHSETLSG